MPRRILPFLLLLPLACIAHADFPAPANSGADQNATPPLTPEEAVKKIRLPEGFRATLFAGEPDVQNPIACAWDSRGRLWIAENYTYAETAKTFDHTFRDRILIFEDTDNDGRHDKRTVFADNLTNLTSIELGYGGLYATAAPHLLFIPDKNRDDKPDSEPEVLLDGFDDWSVRHNFVNGLKWGPDGWLYGRHGIQATSNVGRPGAPDSERTRINCCIWRFHPISRDFEVVCWGGTNSWGHDWTAEGEGFFINTVIGHLYHIIPGAHYERMYGEDLNPHIYELLPQTADHYHFDTSKSWTDSRDGKANDLGGGHAHSGLMIYNEENFPAEYRGKAFTINLHGRRINVDRIERKGSGFTAKHEPDFAFFDDPWFRGVELTYGPDGGMYVLDWSDQGECHENDGVHRLSGRIYKITYGEVKKPDFGPTGDLRDNIGPQILKGWRDKQVSQVIRDVHRYPKRNPIASPWSSLRSWEGFPQDIFLKHVAHAFPGLASHPENREQVVQFIRELRSLPVLREILTRVHEIADRKAMLTVSAAILQHPEVPKDHLLPLLCSQMLLPRLTLAELLEVLPSSRAPIFDEHVARRISESEDGAALDRLLGVAEPFPAARKIALLAGMTKAFKGVARAPKPAHWESFATSLASVNNAADAVRVLNATFGDGRALDEIRDLALDAKADLAARRRALETLITSKAPDLRKICEKLISNRDLAHLAIRGLATFDDDAAAKLAIANWNKVRWDAHAAVISDFATRPVFTRALLDAVAAGKIEREELTPYHARQIAALNDPQINAQLAKVWGEVRTTPEGKKQRIAELKAALTPEVLAKADLTKGREAFSQACAACHRLFDLGAEGTQLGPNLTGSGRQDLTYLLENIVDPNALVPQDYKLSMLALKDGRTLSGFISAQTDQTVTLRSMTDTQTVPKSDVAKTETSPNSLMPEGLLDTLTPEQVRDLFGFLMKK